MQITALELAHLLQGTVEGDTDAIVTQPNKIEIAEQGDITFLANLKYESYAYTTKASILLVSKDFLPKQKITATLVRVDNVYSAITFLLEKFGEKQNKAMGISEKASIHRNTILEDNISIGDFSIISEGVKIGHGTIISPQVFIGANAQIGNNCIIYAGVKIHDNCIIGDNCIIHSNTVVGSDGFGFALQADGTYKKVPQTGNVVIENYVEIGANCSIDRATMGSTIIRKGAKLDNLIMVAHNVEIGENTVIAAQAGVAGSTKIGKNCMVGGQAGFVGHIEIANRTKIQAQSGVNKSIKTEDTAWYGSPALDYNSYLRSYAGFKQLPQLIRQLRELENKLNSLNKEGLDK